MMYPIIFNLGLFAPSVNWQVLSSAAPVLGERGREKSSLISFPRQTAFYIRTAKVEREACMCASVSAMRALVCVVFRGVSFFLGPRLGGQGNPQKSWIFCQGNSTKLSPALEVNKCLRYLPLVGGADGRPSFAFVRSF